jgi:hypothetical protein
MVVTKENPDRFIYFTFFGHIAKAPSLVGGNRAALRHSDS